MRLRIATVFALAATVFAGTLTLASPAVADPVAWPVVHRGDSGLNVRAVQALLREHGSGVAITGHFRFGTLKAVKHFQDSHGLRVTGVVDKATWPDLVVTLRRGDQGAAVRVVQQQLKFLGHYHAVVGGHFGPKTEAAVKDFQEHSGLARTGEMNTFTWRNLLHSVGFPSCLQAMCD